jgi:hypothetical protein
MDMAERYMDWMARIVLVWMAAGGLALGPVVRTKVRTLVRFVLALLDRYEADG